MANAAAAAAGCRKGKSRTLGGRGMAAGKRNTADPLATTGPNVATGIATCACTILVFAGLTSVVHSFTNTRGRLVADYDSSVEEWAAEARDKLVLLSVNVTAVVSSSRNAPISRSMQLVNGTEVHFHDAEGKQGLLDYIPLRFETHFEFASYFPAENASGRSGPWDPLPSREDAPTVEFQFAMRNLSGHVSRFSTQPWPLVYEEAAKTRSPAAQNRCRHHEKGVWRKSECHIVKSLTNTCLQVQLDEAGKWRPHSKVDSNATETTIQAAAGAPTAESFGCDPDAAWHPTRYEKDTCWVAKTREGACADKAAAHRVSVVVRSALDPFIRAEELTENSLNFGFSTISQRTYGMTTLLVGLLLCVVPILRLRGILKSTKGRSCSVEDARSLKYPAEREV